MCEPEVGTADNSTDVNMLVLSIAFGTHTAAVQSSSCSTQMLAAPSWPWCWGRCHANSGWLLALMRSHYRPAQAAVD